MPVADSGVEQRRVYKVPPSAGERLNYDAELLVPKGFTKQQARDFIAHTKRLQETNRWIMENMVSPRQLEEFLSGNRKAYPEEKAAEVDRLNAERHAFADSVRTPEAMLIRSKIEERYKESDAKNQGKSKEEQVAARFATATGSLEVVMDYDNTLTDESEIPKVHGIKTGHPGAMAADPALAMFSDVHGFGEAYTRLYPVSFQVIAHEWPEQFLEAGRLAPIREGAREYLQYLKDHDIPLRFASANVEYTIWGTLSQYKHPGDIQVHAMTPNSTKALEKDAVIATEAIQDPQNAIIYIGDGASDVPALNARDVVALYFALEGSSFAKQLEESGALYFTYNKLTDVIEKLEQIKAINQASPQETQNKVPVLV